LRIQPVSFLKKFESINGNFILCSYVAENINLSTTETGEEGEDNSDMSDDNNDDDDDDGGRECDLYLIFQSVRRLSMGWKIRGSFLRVIENVPFDTKSRIVYSQSHILSDKPRLKETNSRCPAFNCSYANITMARRFPVLHNAVLRKGLYRFVEVIYDVIISICQSNPN